MIVVESSSFGKQIKYKGKMIVFPSIEVAADFMSAFINYSIMRMLNEDAFRISEVFELQNSLRFIEVTEESPLYRTTK